MCSASVEPMPSSISTPKRSVNRSCSGAGNGSPADTHAARPRTPRRAAWRRARRSTSGPRRRAWAGCSRSMRSVPGGAGPRAVEDRARPHREREGERVAQAVGEEELRHREGDVVRADRQHVAGVGLGGVAQRPVPVHRGLGRAGGAGGVQPERGGVGDGRIGRRGLLEEVPPAATKSSQRGRGRRGPPERRAVGDTTTSVRSRLPATAGASAANSPPMTAGGPAVPGEQGDVLRVSIVLTGTGTAPMRRPATNAVSSSGVSPMHSSSRSSGAHPRGAKTTAANADDRVLELGVVEGWATPPSRSMAVIARRSGVASGMPGDQPLGGVEERVPAYGRCGRRWPVRGARRELASGGGQGVPSQKRT